ncbi:hypothetical protein PK28_13415 [Hymenobacter sp. DG25B]|uniref:hypothetical protein n=1 Tax=Hymenobacter sp. DG25B TaxID=1385664 RepID=UPI000540E9B4|nr:hypothetical protein [Hymenobacter sp. DG25B]AIZ64426.1 hypothetical protein PK28_13415 [Hymenobacter sp. DG25B]
MPTSSTSGSDFLSQKTTDELLFLIRNPSLYHDTLVTAAQQELRQRAINPHQAIIDSREPQIEWDTDSGSRINWPAVLTILLFIGGAFLYWWHMPAKHGSGPDGAPGPAVLETVASRPIPNFTAQTKASVQRMKQLLPAAARRDEKATRKYLILAERFWNAEHQSAYLAKEVTTARIDSTFPTQVELTYQEWRKLTSVLVYNHNLKPIMQARVDLMQDVAQREMTALGQMRRNYQLGNPPLNEQVRITMAPVPQLLAELQGKATTLHVSLGK